MDESPEKCRKEANPPLGVGFDLFFCLSDDFSSRKGSRVKIFEILLIILDPFPDHLIGDLQMDLEAVGIFSVPEGLMWNRRGGAILAAAGTSKVSSCH